MRGMGGGYTQILVDGEPMGRGFSMDSIPPEQIERIEIMRAPTAETGARATPARSTSSCAKTSGAATTTCAWA